MGAARGSAGCRLCCLAALLTGLAVLGLSLGQPDAPRSGLVLLGLLGLALLGWLLTLLVGPGEGECSAQAVELRCMEFIKRSAETGYSISNTRPIGPPTISLSDQQRPPAEPPGRRAPSPPARKAVEPDCPPEALHSETDLPSVSSPPSGAQPHQLRQLPPLRHTYRPG